MFVRSGGSSEPYCIDRRWRPIRNWKTTTMYKLHVRTAGHADRPLQQETILEFARLEDALYEAFLQLDAGHTVTSIVGAEVELTAAQIKRNWRAARQ